MAHLAGLVRLYPSLVRLYPSLVHMTVVCRAVEHFKPNHLLLRVCIVFEQTKGNIILNLLSKVDKHKIFKFIVCYNCALVFSNK